jgi:hypothetical protein
MRSVARRVVDRRVLHLIKMWLECSVEETDDRGRKRRTTGARDNGCGIPQGSPISPLVAEAAPADAAWQHEQRNSTDIRQTAGVFESRIAPLTGLDNANCRRPQRARRSGSTSFWARLIGG